VPEVRGGSRRAWTGRIRGGTCRWQLGGGSADGAATVVVLEGAVVLAPVPVFVGRRGVPWAVNRVIFSGIAVNRPVEGVGGRARLRWLWM
jgi:hypothetical protein